MLAAAAGILGWPAFVPLRQLRSQMPLAKLGAWPKRGKNSSRSRARSAASKGEGGFLVIAPVYHTGRSPKQGRAECHGNDPSAANLGRRPIATGPHSGPAGSGRALTRKMGSRGERSRDGSLMPWSGLALAGT
jgi:hypothetical protein